MIMTQREQASFKSKLKGLVTDAVMGVIEDEVFDVSEPHRDREQKVDYIEGALMAEMEINKAIDGLVISDD